MRGEGEGETDLLEVGVHQVLAVSHLGDRVLGDADLGDLAHTRERGEVCGARVVACTVRLERALFHIAPVIFDDVDVGPQAC